MLQWLPGSRTEVIWNDRQDGQFVCHILDVQSRASGAPCPARSTPSARTRSGPSHPDFRRLNDMRPGYGYDGIPDPYKDELAPRERPASGAWT